MKIKPILILTVFVIACFSIDSIANAQLSNGQKAAITQLENLIEPPTEFEFSADTVDESVLAKRIDDLTEISNKHTEQITTLDDRLNRLEKLLSASTKKTSTTKLKTVLQAPKEISVLQQAPLVSTVFSSPPVVTFSTPVVTRVSSPVYYSSPVATVVSSPIAPVARSVYQAPMQPTISSPQSFTSSRIVRMPVQQNRATTIEYSPAAPRRSLGNFFGVPGNCPGGVCPR